MLHVDAHVFTGAREAVAGVLDEVRAEPDLVTAVPVMAGAAAEVAMALHQRDPLTFLRQQRGGDQSGDAGAYDGYVVLHRFLIF